MLKLKKINYYWPSTCTKFIEVEWMNSQSNLEETDEEYNYSNNEMKLEYGIFDAAKHNKLFDSLLSKFELDRMSNLQIYFSIIQNLDDSIPRKNEIPPIYTNDKNLISEIMKNNTDTQKEIEVIALKRINWYSIKSICAKTLLPKEKVNQILSKFKYLRHPHSDNKSTEIKRRVVSSDKIMEIKQICEDRKRYPIYSEDIKSALWSSSEKLENSPWKTTICSILKNELDMSYRLLDKKNAKTTKEAGIRDFVQSFSLQIEIQKKGIELIYFDEFSYSSRK